jgi:hypothetical protein
MKTPEGISQYFYKQSTGGTNLRNHLIKRHPDEYDEASAKYGFLNRRHLRTEDASSQGIRSGRQNLPPFSVTTFMDYLVRFIVADDQVCLTTFCLVSFFLFLYLSSRSVSSSAPNSGNYAWSFAMTSLTPTSLAAIKRGKLSCNLGGRPFSL